MGVKRLGIAVATVLLLIVAGISARYLKRPTTPDSQHFTFATVDRGDIRQVVTTTGQLVPMSSVEVSTQISGLVIEVNADFNTAVKKGEVLARIDPSTYEQSVRRAEADLEAVRASYALNEVNVRRLRGLLKQDLVTQQDFDQAQALLRQSSASLLTRMADVENARVDLQRCTVVSPIDGIVIFRQVEIGKTVVANFSAPTLFVIAPDMSKMRIVAPINEVDIWSVHVGQGVSFTVDALQGKVFNGRLVQIRNPYTPSDSKQSAQSQQQQVGVNSFDGVIYVDNSSLLLRPSLTATVSIFVDERKSVLRIPNGALRLDPSTGVFNGKTADETFRESGGRIGKVYRVSGNAQRRVEPEPVTVRLGMSDGIVTEILEGLRQGDRVITGVAQERPLPGKGLFQ